MARKAKSATLTFDITSDELDMFLEDVNERLQAMESGLLRLEKKHDPETLNSVFRAAHTLKAFAGTVGHHQMANLTHTMETLFDEMREGKLSPTQALIDELLGTLDILKALRDEIVTRKPSGINVDTLLARLSALQSNADDPQQDPTTSLAISRSLTPEQMIQLETAQAAGKLLLEIEAGSKGSFAPAARLYQVAIALMEAGEIIAQQPALDKITEGDETLWLLLATTSTIQDVETLLSEIDELAASQVQPCENPARFDPSAHVVIAEEEQVADRAPGKSTQSQGESTVRISIERLDSLMNLVGELVTNRTRLLQIEDMLRVQYGKDGGAGALSELMPHFNHVIDQLQEEVMRVRMLPIASLFSKCPRLVRDVARTAGKQVNLVIEGEATELDRAVIEAINDPLIHLLRNAVDHGLETPAERQAAGKPATGTVRLTAASVEGQIEVIVSDDGRGIESNKIRQAALKHKLLPEEELNQLTEDEIVDLIFQPNLSTANAVTEVSGRGVGLDVVRTNIEKLSGSVVITSEAGQGTTFRLTLPLTLALVQTMLVTVRNTLFAVPVTSINGAMYVAEANIHTIKGRPALEWQDETLPLLDLREIFTQPHLAATTEQANGAKPSVVLVNWGKHRVGLAVDRIIGQQEIVVKALSPLIGATPGLSGATILGDGRIALIVDVPGLINTTLRTQRASTKQEKL